MPGGRPRGAACREVGPVVAVEKKAGRRRADVVAALAPGAGVGRAGGTDDKAKVTVRMAAVPRHRQPRRASHAALLRWAAGTSLGGPRGGEEEGGREREEGQGTRQEEEEEGGKGQLDDP